MVIRVVSESYQLQHSGDQALHLIRANTVNAGIVTSPENVTMGELSPLPIWWTNQSHSYTGPDPGL